MYIYSFMQLCYRDNNGCWHGNTNVQITVNCSSTVHHAVGGINMGVAILVVIRISHVSNNCCLIILHTHTYIIPYYQESQSTTSEQLLYISVYYWASPSPRQTHNATWIPQNQDILILIFLMWVSTPFFFACGCGFPFYSVSKLQNIQFIPHTACR